MPKGKYRTARNVGFSSERLAPCIYRILAARAYFHGSSPRMWGTHRLQQHADAVLRFIPTHVGNTLRCSGRSAPSPVHPHACGEHGVADMGTFIPGGSSPRMWGTLLAGAEAADLERFIPTHVGNTVSQFHLIAARAVHPHACGEHKYCNDISPRYDGSSPRMWGTRNRRPGEELCIRFIPTHVGNTSLQTDSHCYPAVHPHACGEHRTEEITQRVEDGSSPRMWGTLVTDWSENAACRFIPTHVGNTTHRPAQDRAAPVHPHACGEHFCWYRTLRHMGGSSPRMWGTHLPYRIVFKEEKTPRKIYRLILYSVVRSRGWNATNCSPSNNTGCRRLTPRVWNS